MISSRQKISSFRSFAFLSLIIAWCNSDFYFPDTGQVEAFVPVSKMNKSSRIMSATTSIPTWDDLKTLASATPVGKALDNDIELRKQGKGSPNVHNKVRRFGNEKLPEYTLYRDHAGWCPYCQKTMLLIEAKEIPIQIELVNMRSYGDKPTSFLRKVPNGMLPALEDNDSGNVALDSAYIMEFLEDAHNDALGKPMVPSRQNQPDDYRRYQFLMNLERELFRWWCTLVFRPEQPNMSGGGNPATALMGNLFGKINSDSDADENYVSSNMRGFLECLEKVDDQLKATKGPYFLDYTQEHPTMIDFVFASHVERMLASCAYWKGMDLRNAEDYPQLENVRNWMDALEKHEYYLAFKSDYYTHVKDIPPQYGPGSNGVSRFSKIKQYKADIEGDSSISNAWKLPLEDDDPLQPLFRGIPLPKCVLEASGISPDADGSYLSSKGTTELKTACQNMAAWKLCGNGPAIAAFAARGGPNGAKNVRKTFGAELADPYAETDSSLVGTVDDVLRALATVMLSCEKPNTVPGSDQAEMISAAAAASNTKGVVSSLAYLRDRIGVPRDLPLASARYLRAYLNWAIDVLE